MSVMTVFWSFLLPGRTRLGRPCQRPPFRHLPRIESLEDRRCPSQYLLVGNMGHDSVLRYDGQDGHFIDTFVSADSGGRLRFPYLGLTTDAAHQNLLVSSLNTRSIQRYYLNDGTPNPAAGQAGADFAVYGSRSSYPWGLAVGPTDGNLYVSDYVEDGVLRYDGTTGAYQGVFVPGGSGGLSEANDVHFGPDGNLYVSSAGIPYENFLMRYDGITGAPLPASGRPGAEFIDPIPKNEAGFTFGPDGNLYVAVGGSFGANQVWRFDGTTGDPLPAPGQTGATFVPFGFAQGIQGMTFGDDGNLYVTDTDHGVREFDGQTGTLVRDFVGLGSGGLTHPMSLLFYDAPNHPDSSAGRTMALRVSVAPPVGPGDDILVSDLVGVRTPSTAGPAPHTADDALPADALSRHAGAPMRASAVYIGMASGTELGNPLGQELLAPTVVQTL